MDIRVSGHQVEISDAFRTQASDRLQGIADKYFARSIGANVTLNRGPHDNGFICEILLHPGNDTILKGSGRSPYAHQALDQAADKIEKQLRRYSRRLKDRNGANGQDRAAVQEMALNFNAGYTVFGAAAGDEEEPGDNPIVIAETRVDIPEASVSDAVMMLDLRNTTALLFKNTKTGAYNMVYRREDGNIGWVEPQAG